MYNNRNLRKSQDIPGVSRDDPGELPEWSSDPACHYYEYIMMACWVIQCPQSYVYACRARQRQWVRYASRSAVPPLARSCYQDRLGIISGHTVFCFPVLFQRPARQYVVGAIQLFDITYGSPSEYYLRHQGHPICNSFQLAALGCRAD